MIELLLQAERALSVGLLDRAETLYRQVASADPRNSIAVVGLARVTLDRGDDVGALEMARKALAIDPQNVAAQRMVARLVEVLEYRVAAAAVSTAAPEPEPELAREPEPEPEPELAREPDPELAAEPVPASAPVPAAAPEPPPVSAPEPEPAAPTPEPAPARRRSFLDRLFRR